LSPIWISLSIVVFILLIFATIFLIAELSK
jgi:hypothetical protein